MRISPSSYHTVPRTERRRTADPSFTALAADHEITPGCLIGCLKTVIPGRVFRALAHALADRRPPRVLTVAGLLALYRTGELAGLPGIGRCRYASIQNSLYIAGLITRKDRDGSGKAAQ